MKPKTKEESKIYTQMLIMLADQFYHQTGDNITINREEFAYMLTKQTMHGIELGTNPVKSYKKLPVVDQEQKWGDMGHREQEDKEY